MKSVRCTADALVIRSLPAKRADTDTGLRFRRGERGTAYGESFDRAWLYLTTAAGAGWVSAEYVADAPTLLDVDTFARAAGIPRGRAETWLPHVLEAAERFDFAAPKRMAGWIAQFGHESAGFSRLTENLNYSAAALRRTFPKYFPNDASANEYAGNPERIANRVYANRLGNGDEASGDGWCYRGRGLPQLTGRANYVECGRALGIDLVANPDRLTQQRWAALSAGWFWQTRGLNPLADAGDIVGMTRRINGGTNGLDDRRRRYDIARRALGA